MNKQLVVVALALVSLVGCGGMMPPQTQDSPQSRTIDARGVWTGWLIPDLFPNAITPLRANLSQGGASGQMALTVAMEFIVPPQCFALASGTGEGTLKDDQLTMTLRLNDGGTMTIKGKVRQDKTTKGHLQDGRFEMTGACQSKGTVAMDRP